MGLGLGQALGGKTPFIHQWTVLMALPIAIFALHRVCVQLTTHTNRTREKQSKREKERQRGTE